MGQTLDARQADTIQPKAPSCGIQPANISLTARRTMTRSPTRSSGSTEAPSGSLPDGASLCLLDKVPYISDVLSTQVVDAGYG